MVDNSPKIPNVGEEYCNYISSSVAVLDVEAAADDVGDEGAIDLHVRYY